MMPAVMTAKKLIQKLKKIAKSYTTLYVMGCYGAPLTGANVARYCNNHSYNQSPERTRMIQNAANKNPPVYGFDCVNLIKGVLWGWCGNASDTYGGAVYRSNGVPDVNADTLFAGCSDISADFSRLEEGAALWMPGHIGVFIGDGLAVECTPAFKNCVQITAVLNLGAKPGYNARTWARHGKLTYIEYQGKAPMLSFDVGEIVRFAGGTHYYSSDAVNGLPVAASLAEVTATAPNAKHPYHLRARNSSGQSVPGVYGWVDADTISIYKPTKTIDELAQEVIAGKWGTGQARVKALTEAGYNAAAVQSRVNALLAFDR